MNRSSDAPTKPAPTPAAENSFGTDLLTLNTAIEKTLVESGERTQAIPSAGTSIFLYGLFREVDLEKVTAVRECEGVVHATLDSGIVLDLTGDDARRFGSAFVSLVATGRVKEEILDLHSAYVSSREAVLRRRT